MAEKIDGGAIKAFVRDAKLILSVRTPLKFSRLVIPEFPGDLQLLNLSALYRSSREFYLEMGGRYFPRISSTMRGLSTQDLFKNEIDYPPTLSELNWFIEKGHVFSDAEKEISALLRFSEISLFHEQNHRIIWPLLPPCPVSQADVCRYLNFAEALVVALDMAMGDQIGGPVSAACERMKIIYHPAGTDKYAKNPNKDYRHYLLAILATTYFSLETMHPDDVLGAVNYVLPGQKNINRVAVARAQQLSELFTHVTNPEWQNLNWRSSQKKLKKLQAHSKEENLILPKDPLDLELEFKFAHRVFDHFGLP